jgi:calcium-dependent protein kinase
MVLAIAYLHNHNFAHCDIKLENFLYDSLDADANLKLIDFGFSELRKSSEPILASRGTVNYAAPEVFKGCVTEKCDMWSLGVVVFMLLSGSAPFAGKGGDRNIRAIRTGQYKFSSSRWATVSDDAKDFVRKLLVVDPDARMAAEDCLRHPWLTQAECDTQSDSDRSLSSLSTCDDMLGELRRYSQSSHLRRAALAMMAHHLSSVDLGQIHNTFLSLDTDKTGTITRDNFRTALRGRWDVSEEELCRLFDDVDINHDGEIEYSEFVAAVMSSRVGFSENHMREAFDLFDVSRTGRITVSDLQSVFGSALFEDVCLSTLICEWSGCCPQRGITFEQFSENVRSGAAYACTRARLVDLLSCSKAVPCESTRTAPRRSLRL